MGNMTSAQSNNFEMCITVLKKGVEYWNNWRIDNPEIRPYLFPPGGLHLESMDLEGINFNDCNLQAAWLTNANLENASFDNANLDVAKFANTNLRTVSFKNAFLGGTNFSNSDLSYKELREMNFKGCKFNNANLSNSIFRFSVFQNADLSNADLSNSSLIRTINTSAKFVDAKLINSNLSLSDCSNANFKSANLTNAKLTKGIFTNSNFERSNLREASLEGAVLVETNFSEAILDNSRVYGVSAWNVNLDKCSQNDLIISKGNEMELTVDNLEISQFLYLLINNKNLRAVIDTMTSKVVLILGRFTAERKATLDAIKIELRKKSYLPVIVDFETSPSRDITETVRTIASLSRFIIADITDPRSIPQELQVIVPDMPSVIVQPIILKGQTPYDMFSHFTKYPWVLKLYEYENCNDLCNSLSNNLLAPIEELLSLKNKFEYSNQIGHRKEKTNDESNSTTIKSENTNQAIFLEKNMTDEGKSTTVITRKKSWKFWWHH